MLSCFPKVCRQRASHYWQKMYVNKMSFFSQDPADKKRTAASRPEAWAQRAVGTFKKHFTLGEEIVSLARTSERIALPSTPTSFHRPGKRARIRPSRLDLDLALRLPLQKKRCSSHSYQGYKVIAPVLVSETVRLPLIDLCARSIQIVCNSKKDVMNAARYSIPQSGAIATTTSSTISNAMKKRNSAVLLSYEL